MYIYFFGQKIFKIKENDSFKGLTLVYINSYNYSSNPLGFNLLVAIDIVRADDL